jgi:glycosyltransferase involved in cell wall biosynthesis
MRSLVGRLLSEQSIGAIHADQISMAQFALARPELDKVGSVLRPGLGAARRPLLVFDAHNATWSIVERMLDTLPGKRAIFKPMLRMEARRVKSYEGLIVKHFDHTLAVTEIDRQALLEAMRAYEAGNRVPSAPSRDPSITVIPIAVDTVQRLPIRRQAGSTNILTLGTLYYPPNADGIRWFARDVFPLVRQRVPAATLTIVGKNPPQDFVQMAEHDPESIRVTGYVPELEPYLEAAALVVVPVRAGSGMRVRILEMFAHAMPVVTTTIGLEGIEAQHGKEVLVSDTPNAFAGEVDRCLQDPSLQEQLAVQGRRLAEEKYDWKVALSKLENIYASSGEARG